MPHLTEDTAPYTLRSCLGKEPLAQVKSVDDDIRDMWKRLDEKYGDPARVADAIINDIRRVRGIKEGDNRRFVEFVGIIEDGYRDLKRLGLETEITTTSSVSIIERKLPADVRKEWAKLLSADESAVNKTDKFSSLLKFLLGQKRAVEYDSSEENPALNEVKPVHYIKGVKIEDFYNIENLGINCAPRCGGFKCSKCAPGSNNYTLKEERELKLIKKGLQYDEQDRCWIVKYP